ADIDHVAGTEFMLLFACVDRSSTAYVDRDQLAPVEKVLRAGRLDRGEFQRLARWHRTADDHAVVMRVGETDATGLEQIAEVEVAAQLVSRHGGRGLRVDRVAG